MKRHNLAKAVMGLLVFAIPPMVQGQQYPSSAPAGPRFLVRLDDKLSTKDDQVGRKFKANTIEPFTTTDGFVVEPGAQVRGHISRIEPARVTGHARLWLTFDEIHSKAGKLYLVADVVDVPGEHFVRADERHEGEISTKTSRGRNEVEAAAAGAVIGAAAGGAARGGRGAAIGAAAGAAAGFLVSSGMGQEMVLQKGTKLELELERPLYVAKR